LAIQIRALLVSIGLCIKENLPQPDLIERLDQRHTSHQT